MLWPSIAGGETSTPFTWKWLRQPKVLALAATSFVPLFLVIIIATFPGEWIEDRLPSVDFIPFVKGIAPNDEEGRRPAHNFENGFRLLSLHELLVAGEIDSGARRPRSLWSNRLVLPGLDIVDYTKFDTETKIAGRSHTVVMRSRHLEGAVLIGANLRKADFGQAHLRGASLNNAQLQGASFEYAQLQGASLDDAHLQGASLSRADLRGASLNHVDLQFAELNNADLRGATLEDAGLEGADLSQAQIQGASLRGSVLHGVSLSDAHTDANDFREVSVVRTFGADRGVD
jgi:hypothetical protein